MPQASRIRCPFSLRGRRSMQQVAAKFADVLEQRAVPTDHVAPEPLAENFSRITSDPPATRIAPGACTPPTL